MDNTGNSNNNNNMLANLLPLLTNQGGGKSNMLTGLLPLLMNKGGSNNDLLKTLLPAMTSNNPQMSDILKNMNFGGNASSDSQEHSESETIHNQQIPDCSKKSDKGRVYTDYSKLYPQMFNNTGIDLNNMPRVNDYYKAASENEPVNSTPKTPKYETNSNNNRMSSLMQLLPLLQTMRSPTISQEKKISAIDGIAPPKIKKSLRAILELNNIIKE